MIEKKTGLSIILFLYVLLLCFGTIATAETYNYAGSDGDWQGQLTLTVNSDGSALLNGASVVGGTIENIATGTETYSIIPGHEVTQELVLTGSQGYAGTGAVDGNGNSAGTQVSFTNGENVVVDQSAIVFSTLFSPVVPSGSSGPYGPPLGSGVFAGQLVGAGPGNNLGFPGPNPDSHFGTLIASTSAHNADGSIAGVSAQAVATDVNASFFVIQEAATQSVLPVRSDGSYGGVRYGSATLALQIGDIENISTATIQAYAANPQVSTTGSLSVSDGNLSPFSEIALARQGTNFAASEYGTSSNPTNVALVEAGGLIVGKSGGSNVVSTFSNGDLATVTSSFSITNGSRADYPALDFNLIGLAASNSSADLVWARTNITDELHTVPFRVPSIDGDGSLTISTDSYNSLSGSLGQIVETPLDTPLGFIGAGTGIFRTADNTRPWQRQWHTI